MKTWRPTYLAAAAITSVALVAAVPASAQFVPSGPRGVVANPCPPPLQPPPELAVAMRNPNQPPPPAVQAFLQEVGRRAQTDWPDLCRYAADDATLAADRHGRIKAVLLGDSITEGWFRSDPSFFTKNDLVGRGISGQVSGQTLLRFQQDVVELHPQVVQIMIGTNDVAGNAGPTTYEDVERNLIAMVQLARANGIRVVLATIPPTSDFPWRRGMEPAEKIVHLNDWLRSYASREHIVVADYHSALKNAAGGFRMEWTGDGVHPNAAGYAVMEPIAQNAISAALARPD